jgi:hypothetical protein
MEKFSIREAATKLRAKVVQLIIGLKQDSFLVCQLVSKFGLAARNGQNLNEDKFLFAPTGHSFREVGKASLYSQKDQIGQQIYYSRRRLRILCIEIVPIDDEFDIVRPFGIY